MPNVGDHIKSLTHNNNSVLRALLFPQSVLLQQELEAYPVLDYADLVLDYPDYDCEEGVEVSKNASDSTEDRDGMSQKDENSEPIEEDLDSFYDAVDTDTGSFDFVAMTDRRGENIQKFLLQSTPDQVRALSLEVLANYSKHEAAIEVLPRVKVEILEILLERIPGEVISEIAETPGLLQKMSDDRLLAFASNDKVRKLP